MVYICVCVVCLLKLALVILTLITKECSSLNTKGTINFIVLIIPGMPI